MTNRSIESAKDNLLEVMGDMMTKRGIYTNEELEAIELSMTAINIAVSRIQRYVREEREKRPKKEQQPIAWRHPKH